MDATLKKQNGIHYTPRELAQFLARQTAACFRPSKNDRIKILDPACGDGELLASMVEALRQSSRPELSGAKLELVGFETDPQAVARSQVRLASFEHVSVEIRNEDFLSNELGNHQFDCVISNPPYVRTQVLGGAVAQQLARKFQLNGRVDLYQAFVVAMSYLLRSQGTLGLLTSNRFLTVRSGISMRKFLSAQFDLKQVFDLGDTRLFEAAVLPVVLTGNKREKNQLKASGSNYCRVYRTTSSGSNVNGKPEIAILDAVDDSAITGEVETRDGRFLIERGELVAENDSAWTLGNSMTRKWLGQIRAHQCKKFGDLAEIKVGIKTTADAVFIRDDWESLSQLKPESELLLPLITHHDANRWKIDSPKKKVLYPYDTSRSRRTPVQLADFPRSEGYLESHRKRLEGRRYVIDSGRNWYEIWVPHQPAQWARPKLVWPDIAEEPRFFLDSSGAVVNGDCYWIKLRDGVDPDWLYLMLAVANSELATKFYDTMFHNKLYAGRRRYMTQYVKEFPLPALSSNPGKRIVKIAKRLVNQPSLMDETTLKNLVEQAFGF